MGVDGEGNGKRTTCEWKPASWPLPEKISEECELARRVYNPARTKRILHNGNKSDVPIRNLVIVDNEKGPRRAKKKCAENVPKGNHPLNLREYLPGRGVPA